MPVCEWFRRMRDKMRKISHPLPYPLAKIAGQRPMHANKRRCLRDTRDESPQAPPHPSTQGAARYKSRKCRKLQNQVHYSLHAKKANTKSLGATTRKRALKPARRAWPGSWKSLGSLEITSTKLMRRARASCRCLASGIGQPK